jgi:hypothetical protein
VRRERDREEREERRTDQASQSILKTRQLAVQDLVELTVANTVTEHNHVLGQSPVVALSEGDEQTRHGLLQSSDDLHTGGLRRQMSGILSRLQRGKEQKRERRDRQRRVRRTKTRDRMMADAGRSRARTHLAIKRTNDSRDRGSTASRNSVRDIDPHQHAQAVKGSNRVLRQ